MPVRTKSDGVKTKKRSLTINKNTEKKIRRLQARLISETGENWSYSTVISILAEQALKSVDTRKFSKN